MGRMKESMFDDFNGGTEPRAYARATDPSTSHDAAAAVTPNVSELEGICLAAIRESSDGLTSKELAQITGINVWSVSPRLRPMLNRGLLVTKGKRDKCKVWRIRGAAEKCPGCLQPFSEYAVTDYLPSPDSPKGPKCRWHLSCHQSAYDRWQRKGGVE